MLRRARRADRVAVPRAAIAYSRFSHIAAPRQVCGDPKDGGPVQQLPGHDDGNAWLSVARPGRQ